jgi:uncharacterized protein YuzE
VSLVSTYDWAVDALYIYARPGVSVAETVELDPRVIVDRDADGVAIGVELLSAARQEIADVALRAIRGRPSAAEPD